MTSSEILSRLKGSLQAQRKNYHAEIRALFGSYARGDHDASSDLDLLYKPTDRSKFGLLEIEGLENFIKEITNIESIDLVDEDYINPIIALEIENELIYV